MPISQVVKLCIVYSAYRDMHDCVSVWRKWWCTIP